MDAGLSGDSVPPRKNSSGKRRSKFQGPHAPSGLKSSVMGVSPRAVEELGGSIALEGKAQGSPLGSRCRGASGNTLLLDFRSMRIMGGDADEDSASDLSDSERVPVPPSPRRPPDLRLRAEEIDPVCFDLDLQPGAGHAGPEYCYPDFLPPPWNSWDLRDRAVLENTEHRPGAGPRAGGLLGRYVDRLVRLEWLQVLTVQGERARGAKARPPPVPGAAAPLQSPGRSKLPAGAAARPHQNGAPKPGPSRKKGFHRQDGRPCRSSSEAPAEALDVLSTSRLSSQKQALDVRTEEKRQRCKSPRPPRWELAGSDSSWRMESSGNARVPRPATLTLDSADPHKASNARHANLKKKGNTENCGHASRSSEKKLETDGGKQNTHKLKQRPEWRTANTRRDLSARAPPATVLWA
ncbi:LOW QUALITY PROTEIN: protein FAM217B [Molossus nigricans]